MTQAQWKYPYLWWFRNSLRDMFSGDTITGLIRCMEALLLALVVGLGFTVANLLF